jgi:putative transposase
LNPPDSIFDEGGFCVYGEEREQTHGALYHPMTQGETERYHRSMKNKIDLRKYYSNESCHESKDNVTPADVYYGRHHEIITWRDEL